MSLISEDSVISEESSPGKTELRSGKESEKDGKELGNTLLHDKVNGHVKAERSNFEEECLKMWNMPLNAVFDLSLKLFQELDKKGVLHIKYEDRLQLISLKRLIFSGPYCAEKAPSLGLLDFVGAHRRKAWIALGDMTGEEAMWKFVSLLDKLCSPVMRSFVEAHRQNDDSLQNDEAEDSGFCDSKRSQSKYVKRYIEEQLMQYESDWRQKLKEETKEQFEAYAKNQFPNDDNMQRQLIAQLQEQHFREYINLIANYQADILAQQLSQHTEPRAASDTDLGEAGPGIMKSSQIPSIAGSVPVREQVPHQKQTERHLSGMLNGTHVVQVSSGSGALEMATIWTRKDIEEFKASVKGEAGGDGVLKINHGEIVTIRVPTHPDGNCLFWEFASDSYDLAFGMNFEWCENKDYDVTIHISDSDSDEEEGSSESDETSELSSGAESAGEGDMSGGNGVRKSNDSAPERNSAPLDEIIALERRDCHIQVVSGRHSYPGEGAYLLKFDNSYSLWRAKTLYYRVYYTK